MTWSDYIDESYNARTFCVGGLLGPVKMWTDIVRGWTQRIAYENRKSAIKGFPPISRYHATYCANLKGDFSQNRGWDIPRQIRFSKRLCEIIGSHGPCAIVHGGNMEDVQKYLPPDLNLAKEYLYYISIYLHLVQVGSVMDQHFPAAKVTVYYDRSKQFGRIAEAAFNAFMKDESAKSVSKYFITIASAGWEDCVPLQPADLMVYEGMKRVDGSLRGQNQIRKSLLALLNNNRMPVFIEYFTKQNVNDLIRIGKNHREGRPLEEGVISKLSLCSNQ
jgi:hypothetical protein